MQNAEQYRLFAETLAAAAETAPADTRDMLLSAANAWRALADDDGPDGGDRSGVIDLAQARRRLRAA